jgi:hypothetical protein
MESGNKDPRKIFVQCVDTFERRGARYQQRRWKIGSCSDGDESASARLEARMGVDFRHSTPGQGLGISVGDKFSAVTVVPKRPSKPAHPSPNTNERASPRLVSSASYHFCHGPAC